MVLYSATFLALRILFEEEEENRLFKVTTHDLWPQLWCEKLFRIFWTFPISPKTAVLTKAQPENNCGGCMVQVNKQEWLLSCMCADRWCNSATFAVQITSLAELQFLFPTHLHAVKSSQHDKAGIYQSFEFHLIGPQNLIFFQYNHKQNKMESNVTVWNVSAASNISIVVKHCAGQGRIVDASWEFDISSHSVFS